MFGRKKPIRVDNPLVVAFYENDNSLNVRIDAAQLEEPGWAGIIPADLEVHFASALAATGKAASVEGAVEQIRAVYMAEIANPTDAPTGRLEN
ncbi:MAG: hypothetical protein GY717_03590 [Rhodobacteraceae bacterium]|nr:hypothetical protein [Paracoccaceae bacterium]